MTELPPFPDQCWPVDWACCAAPATGMSSPCGHDEETKVRAEALAGQTLRSLTGYRVGGCPITVRPCREGCGPIAWTFDSYGASFQPGITIDGTWVNTPCGCTTDCSCTALCEVRLPGPVGYIESVRIDGTVIPETWYRVDNGNTLVWVGDPAQPEMDCKWPVCQDMAKPITEVGTFAVTYLRGIPVDGLGSFVAGILACEYAKACSGEACRLPRNVTGLARQGVAMQIEPASFSGGLTGIPEVDSYIRYWNPNLLKQPSKVWSPDVRRPRVTTWQAS